MAPIFTVSVHTKKKLKYVMEGPFYLDIDFPKIKCEVSDLHTAVKIN